MKKTFLAFLLFSIRAASAQSSGGTTSLRQSVTTFMDASDHGDQPWDQQRNRNIRVQK